jgi:hypothetical protein
MSARSLRKRVELLEQILKPQLKAATLMARSQTVGFSGGAKIHASSVQIPGYYR